MSRRSGRGRRTVVAGGRRRHALDASGRHALVDGGHLRALVARGRQVLVDGGRRRDLVACGQHSLFAGGRPRALVASGRHSLVAGGRRRAFVASGRHALGDGGRRRSLVACGRHALVDGGRRRALVAGGRHAFFVAGRREVVVFGRVHLRSCGGAGYRGRALHSRYVLSPSLPTDLHGVLPVLAPLERLLLLDFGVSSQSGCSSSVRTGARRDRAGVHNGFQLLVGDGGNDLAALSLCQRTLPGTQQ